MKVAIVGYGFVGKAVHKLFPEAVIYDPGIKDLAGNKAAVNSCAAAFICVPTNSLPDGACDTSIVDETLTWLGAPLIIIRSTVKPGTTEKLQKQYPQKHLVFQPEYIGETVAHPLKDESSQTFIILGGTREACDLAVQLYHGVYNSAVKIMFLRPTEAEIVKYMANSATAMMVTFVNEFYNICQAFGADYHMVREAFLLDPRMSRYATFVYPAKRGFDGKCLPKDLNALVKASAEAGYQAEFISDILKSNERIKKSA